MKLLLLLKENFIYSEKKKKTQKTQKVLKYNKKLIQIFYFVSIFQAINMFSLDSPIKHPLGSPIKSPNSVTPKRFLSFDGTENNSSSSPTKKKPAYVSHLF